MCLFKNFCEKNVLKILLWKNAFPEIGPGQAWVVKNFCKKYKIIIRLAQTRISYILDKTILVVFSGYDGTKVPSVFNPNGLGKISARLFFNTKIFKTIIFNTVFLQFLTLLFLTPFFTVFNTIIFNTVFFSFFNKIIFLTQFFYSF